MTIMGLPSWLHWLAWFIKQFSFLLISVVLIVILFKVSSLIHAIAPVRGNQRNEYVRDNDDP